MRKCIIQFIIGLTILGGMTVPPRAHLGIMRISKETVKILDG